MRRSLAGMVGTLVLVAASASDAQELGQGIAKYQSGDFVGALRDLMPFAEQGSPVAQTHVAVIYADGQGVVRDNLAAAAWMRLAAEQEHAQAQFNFAQMHERGQGVAQDLTGAVNWYERAARLGYAPAQFRLGTMLEQGVGVARNFGQAVDFYRMAAEQDHAAAHLLLYYAPLENWRRVDVKENHVATTWAEGVRRLVKEDFPEAERITLVMDNLNTRAGASLYKAFAAPQARRLLEKLELVYTPKHGSWPDMAEIEFSAMDRQCLNRRLADIDTVDREATAWATRRNASGTPAQWRFTTEDARIKLHSLYPSIS